MDSLQGYVDWRKQPAMRGRHGGMLAASFVLVVEALENLAYLANASNLVLYLVKFMHLLPLGTAFLLALLGGFLADSFFTTYCIYLISAIIEFSGLVLLTLQACIPALKPLRCKRLNTAGLWLEVSGGSAVMLFAGLYLLALGVGGIKGSLPPHGAEQFDDTTPVNPCVRTAARPSPCLATCVPWDGYHHRLSMNLHGQPRYIPEI